MTFDFYLQASEKGDVLDEPDAIIDTDNDTIDADSFSDRSVTPNDVLDAGPIEESGRLSFWDRLFNKF